MKLKSVALVSLLFLTSCAFRIVGATHPSFCSDDDVGVLIDNIYDTCIKDISSSACATALHTCKSYSAHNCCNCLGPVLWIMCSSS